MLHSNNKIDAYDFRVPEQSIDRSYQELVHRVFEQNADGKKLLKIWNNRIMTSFTEAKNPHFVDGYECFVKQINYCINQINEG